MPRTALCPVSWPPCGLLALLALLTGGLVAGVGCQQDSTSAEESDAPAEQQSPEEKQVVAVTAQGVLDDMVAAYQNAASYSDRGRVRLRFKHEDQEVDDTADYAVTFVRPNKLKLQCYQGAVICDGEEIFASIADLEGQVLKQSAPAPFTMDSIYSMDEVLTSVLSEGIAGASPQLALLLSAEPLEGLLAESQGLELLEPAELEGTDCHRVQMAQPEGNVVFWVDRDSHVLRRVDFPGEPLAKMFPEGTKVTDLALWAEFVDARLGADMSTEVFRAAPPEGVRLVEQFDLRAAIPPPQPPSKLLGTQVADFVFTTLDGKPVMRKDLEGKVVVLDFWATWCGPCTQSVPAFERVHQQFKDNDRVRFLAVSIDQPGIANDQLQAKADELGLSVQIVRDLKLHAPDKFDVRGIPCLWVLGPDGTLQDNEVGVNPALAAELPGRIEKLLAGEDLHPLVKKRYEERLRAHEQQVEAAGKAGSSPGHPAKAEIAPKSEPGTLVLEELWENSELSRPGNIVVFADDDGTSKLLVNDEYATAAVLGADGTVLARKKLEVPDGAAITYFRTARDAEGNRYFVGSAGAQPRVHLFDGDVKRLTSYPQQQGQEISDVQLVDLDGDGTLEMAVAYWGATGLEGVSLDGRKLWANDSLKNIMRLATGAADESGHRHLLVAHQEGTLGVVDHAGNSGAIVAVGERFVRMVAAAELAGETRLCGLAPSPSGADVAIGFTTSGSELWSYELPPGLHGHPIEMITTGSLTPDGPGHWVLAAGDGSVHLLTSAGVLVDRFNTGTPLTGIALSVIDGHAVLLLSTPERLSAYRVKARE